MFARELIGRHQSSSWLPEGEGPPPYRGAVGLHRYPLQPLQVQHSYPDLPTFGYRLVDLALLLIIIFHNCCHINVNCVYILGTDFNVLS